ncbi:Sperm associated antigen 1 [Desmophyllum pertusum]|uniref:Sperm associated antigen 1 n=1 Tax=Desmophyllum pertusum TaxID=174260 RepID=A0A9W9YIW4_9CNID|nr:Sperm associated antigen 1 [Desmophyllum pertusum]
MSHKSETERQVLSNREKEKGNEAFQTGHYSEALMYYCRSIELNPKAAAVYNNRALAEIKLEKFQEAIDDCNHVLSVEPKNVKAYLRRSIAHQGQGLNKEAKEDLCHVLAIEPNNKRAKELLEGMKKTESTNGSPIKLGNSEESENYKNESDDNERTSSNTHIAIENVATTTPKGKRLKIVEVDGENEPETSQNFNAEKSQVEKLPQLPGLVLKAQDEGKRLFKLGRYAEAAEEFTQAIDILQKGKDDKD